MTRDTRMLLAIVAGAALAGWLVVRLMSPAPEAPVVAEAPVAEEPAPPETLARADDRAAPADPDDDAAGDDVDAEAVMRDLETLVRAVRKDKHLDTVVFPESTAILHLPSVVQYTRLVDFWQPAFAKSRGDS